MIRFSVFLVLLISFAGTIRLHAQQTVTVEDGHLVIRIKLGPQVDLNRLKEALDPASAYAKTDVPAVLQEYLIYLKLDGKEAPAWVSALLEHWYLVDRLNAGPDRLERIGSMQLRYDPATRKVVEAGSIKVRYDILSGRITQLGDIVVAYDLTTGRVTRIGPLRIEYDLARGGIRRFTEN